MPQVSQAELNQRIESLVSDGISQLENDLAYFSFNFTDAQRDVFYHVNHRMAQADNRLSYAQQSDQIRRSILQLIHTTKSTDLELIYKQAMGEINAVSAQRVHQERSSRAQVNQPLHACRMDQLMQDEHLSRLMPQDNSSNIFLAPLARNFNSVNHFDLNDRSMVDGIRRALDNPQIERIFLPIGPSHWRLFTLTKPKQANGKYDLELFDSMGTRSAAQIKDFSIALLKNCGINERQISIGCSRPNHSQKDSYSCGDYVVAQAHRKMKECHLDYNQELVSVLENQGNANNALRQVTRNMSAQQNSAVPVFHEEKRATQRPSAQAKPALLKKPVVKEAAQTGSMAKMKQLAKPPAPRKPETVTESTAVDSSIANKVIEASFQEAQQKAPNAQLSTTQAENYKTLVHALVNSRDTLVGLVKGGSDQALAAQLQIEELDSAFKSVR